MSRTVVAQINLTRSMAAVLFALGLILPSSVQSDDLRRDCKQANGRDKLVACSKAIESSSKEASLYLERGFAWAQLNRLRLSEDDFTMVISLDPANAVALANRCYARTGMARHAEAIADCDRAISLAPTSVMARNNRAWALFKAGRAREGIEDIEIALSLKPDYWAALDTRGHIREATGEREEAIADFRRALMLKPDLQESKDALLRMGVTP